MDKNPPLLDSESAVEIARLLLQDRMVTRSLESLFPEQKTVYTPHRVLDVACGPGSWAIDVAHTYPFSEVVGIDISRGMIEYALSLVRLHKARNVHFEIMNALEPLDFADASFDLVNIRFGASSIPRNLWSQLLSECLRVLQSKGIIRLTEANNLGITNSNAYIQLNRLYARALHKVGYGFSSDDGETLSITPMLDTLLQDRGYQGIQQRAYALDFSFGAAYHESQSQNLMTYLLLIQPFLTMTGVVNEEDFYLLYGQIEKEMQQEIFEGLTRLIILWGEKR